MKLNIEFKFPDESVPLLMILWRIAGTDVEAFMDGINRNALRTILISG